MWRQVFGIALAVGSGLGAVLAGCARPAATQAVEASSPPAEGSPDLVLRRVSFARIRSGQLDSWGTADEVAYHRDTGRTSALATRITFAQRQPDPSALGQVTAAAKSLDGDLGTRSGEAQGGILVTTQRGDVLETPAAAIAAGSGVAESLGSVAIRGADYTLNATRARVRLDGSQLEFGPGVQTVSSAPAVAPSPVRERRRR